MKLSDALGAYLPGLVVAELLRGPVRPPSRQRCSEECVCLFADVSGFTRLSEQLLASRGARGGTEDLARHIRSYFSQLVVIFGSCGAELIKFAGDACVVFFSEEAPGTWPLSERVHAACQVLRAAARAARRQQLLR
jgi:class 3 adenylate cyclase